MLRDMGMTKAMQARAPRLESMNQWIGEVMRCRLDWQAPVATRHGATVAVARRLSVPGAAADRPPASWQGRDIVRSVDDAHDAVNALAGHLGVGTEPLGVAHQFLGNRTFHPRHADANLGNQCVATVNRVAAE